MSGSYGWWTIIFCGIVTLGIRASFIVLPPDTKVPAWLQRGLKYVAAAVLPALIAPDVLFRDAAPGDVLNVYRIIAALLAGVVAIRTRNTFATLVTGMATLWLLNWWGPL